MWDKGSIFWVGLYVVSCTTSKDFSVCYTFKKGIGKGEYFLASVGKKRLSPGTKYNSRQ